jgi:hypothetical protein
METSFSRNYDSIPHPDGSISLHWKEQRFGAHSGGIVVALIIGLFAGSCAITAPFLAPLGPNRAGSGSDNVFTAWAIVSMLITCGALFFIARTKGEITIVPGEGLKLHNGKIIAKKDIVKIVTMHATTGKNAKGTASVQARVHGQDIRISRHMSLALAESLADEIQTLL